MIRHIVLFKWKADAPKAAVNRFIEELNKLPAQNRDVSDWNTGPEIAPPVFGGGSFDYGLACLLEDRAAVERYRDHPWHQHLAAMLPEVLGTAAAFDFNIEDTA